MLQSLLFGVRLLDCFLRFDGSPEERLKDRQQGLRFIQRKGSIRHKSFFYFSGCQPDKITRKKERLERFAPAAAWFSGGASLRNNYGVDHMDYAIRAGDIRLHDIGVVDHDLSALSHNLNVLAID